jgi:hypothetical protein
MISWLTVAAAAASLAAACPVRHTDSCLPTHDIWCGWIWSLMTETCAARHGLSGTLCQPSLGLYSTGTALGSTTGCTVHMTRDKPLLGLTRPSAPVGLSHTCIHTGTHRHPVCCPLSNRASCACGWPCGHPRLARGLGSSCCTWTLAHGQLPLLLNHTPGTKAPCVSLERSSLPVSLAAPHTRPTAVIMHSGTRLKRPGCPDSQGTPAPAAAAAPG